MAKISGVSIRHLAQTYGTPLLVYNEEELQKKMRTFKTTFVSGKFETNVLYASKAFLCKAMAKLAAKEGLGLDVVSGGELYCACEAGFDTSEIYFHGNNKTTEELKLALQVHTGTIIVDNIEEAKELAELTRDLDYTVNALLRVNPGIEAHTHQYIVTAHVDSKFGISFLNEEELTKTIQILLEAEHVAFRGLHAHIGSQIFDINAFKEEIRKLFAYAAHLKETYGFVFDTLNLGGGFGAKYTEKDQPIPIEEVTAAIIKTAEEEQNKTCAMIHRLLIEPGRSIAAEAGSTIYTIGNTKTTPNRHYIFVDGGMSDNIRPALYQAEYDAFIDGKEQSTEKEICTVAGKCCESGDLLIETISLPHAEKGDLLVMKTTGAYGYSMASHYNRNPLPAVVFVKEGMDRLVIQRESYAHMTALEI